ncbi:MAG: PEP-CTERM sorting domain-containing protein [Nostoc sp. GBBB01]|uniref:PEP-CTERM sorting domain-containing protein n=1 Tax=Nostoc punctiforme FACHB-252 TaxID=1357509 RepID=A0ABR8H7A6_NOSPU|nr:exosortase-dependent surface protein XDP2 [Nostoc punctiforme]MBD2611272.1 PEP-CTERM sorting domain-containing protein [Nostoc punctiforme FACHB-252]MBL1199780.1 PEP-CTERM sorting domain-containing protein [Nostoc sp. GBBB01]
MKTILAKMMAIATSTTSISVTSLMVAVPAQAASFTAFSFKTNVTATPINDPTSNLLNDPTRDIRLDSVEFNNTTINNFEVVNQAKILQNDTYTLPDTSVFGVLNSGRGPNTADDNLVPEGPSKPNPTDQDIVGSLGNLNLNSILVTRENANKASIEVSFANPVNTFFFWERGGTAGGTVAGDSDLLVEALDDNNAVIGTYKILRQNYTKADYNISTVVAPILNNGPFNIGSIGITLDGITTKTLRLTSSNNNGLIPNLPNDNGPDFKVVAAKVEVVPEPTAIVGVLLVSGLGLVLKRKKIVTG